MRRMILSFTSVLITYSLLLSAAGSDSQSANNEDTTEGTEDREKGKKEKKPESNLLKIGNLAFPPSQQPSPLISFGQNILNKKQAQALFLATDFKGDNEYFVNVAPTILYGLTDDVSLSITAPFAVRFRQGDHHSSGVEDMTIQLEYAYYTQDFVTYYDQATIVANVTLPTGSAKKDPPTGIGANSFLLGGTFSRMGIDWFYFSSYGGIFTCSSHRTQFGNQFLYQGGLGRRICNTPDWLFAWMVEIDGTYTWKNKIHGIRDPNSGGNVVYATPSLFVASENLILQLGCGIPVQQNLFGNQERNEYLLALNLGWTF